MLLEQGDGITSERGLRGGALLRGAALGAGGEPSAAWLPSEGARPPLNLIGLQESSRSTAGRHADTRLEGERTHVS